MFLCKTLIYMWRSATGNFGEKGLAGGAGKPSCALLCRVAGNESGSGQRRGDRERERWGR